MNNISLYRIIQYQLAHRLRQLKTVAWLNTALSYMQMMLLRWDETFLEARRQAYMTPQICYLEKYLQIRFGDNSIQILKVRDLAQYAYWNADNPTPDEDLYLSDPTYFYLTDDINRSRFVVLISQGAWDNFSESILSTIHKYSLPGYEFIYQII